MIILSVKPTGVEEAYQRDTSLLTLLISVISICMWLVGRATVGVAWPAAAAQRPPSPRAGFAAAAVVR